MPVAPEPEVPSTNGEPESGDWGYVPMSEWGDDLGRTR